MKYISYYESKIGNMTLASDGEYLTGLWFDGQKYDREGLKDDWIELNLPIFDCTKTWLDIYFSEKNPKFSPKIKFISSNFRREVLNILLSIPYGQTISYGQISKIIAKKRNLKSMSSQAVGNAVAHNPISIIIPCHRVLGKDGSLTGYAGGIDKKRKLLEIEKIKINCREK